MREKTYLNNEKMKKDVIAYLQQHQLEGVVYIPKEIIASSLPNPISRTTLYIILNILQAEGIIELEQKKIRLRIQ